MADPTLRELFNPELVQEPPGSQPTPYAPQPNQKLVEEPISGKFVSGRRRLGTFSEELERIEREQPGALNNPQAFRQAREVYDKYEQQELAKRQESVAVVQQLHNITKL